MELEIISLLEVPTNANVFLAARLDVVRKTLIQYEQIEKAGKALIDNIELIPDAILKPCEGFLVRINKAKTLFNNVCKKSSEGAEDATLLHNSLERVLKELENDQEGLTSCATIISLFSPVVTQTRDNLAYIRHAGETQRTSIEALVDGLKDSTETHIKSLSKAAVNEYAKLMESIDVARLAVADLDKRVVAVGSPFFRAGGFRVCV